MTVSVGGQTFEALNEMYIEDVGFIISQYEVAFTYDDTIDFGGENQYKVLYLSDEILRKAMETAAASDSYYIDLKISVCGGKIEGRWEGWDYVRDAVCVGFCTNEVLSITENLGLAGVPMPQAVVKALEQLLK